MKTLDNLNDRTRQRIIQKILKKTDNIDEDQLSEFNLLYETPNMSDRMHSIIAKKVRPSVQRNLKSQLDT